MCDGFKTRCATEFYTMASVPGWRANPWNGLSLKKTTPKTVPGKVKGCSHLFILGDQSNSFHSHGLKRLWEWKRHSRTHHLCAPPTFQPASSSRRCSVSFPTVRAKCNIMTMEAHPRSLSEAAGSIFDISIHSFSLFFLKKKIPFFILPISSYWAPTDFWALCWLLKI